jgi:putative component of toxin-antitoxin plasmid stabilization module
MPETTVLFYQDNDGQVPVLEWLRGLQRRDRKAYAKCVARIRRLASLGHELRRPEADFLRDGIYELRAKTGRVNYRILYFFHGRNVAILGHALAKEDKVPDADIMRAIRCKETFKRDPARHSYEGDLSDG